MSDLFYDFGAALFRPQPTKCGFKRRPLGLGVAFLSSLLLLATCTAARGQTSTPYKWNNVKIGGGGFVTHIVFDPKTPGTLYARTDTGGAYKRSHATSDKWVPLTDFFGPKDAALTGVESIAVDPVDNERVYLAVGMHDTPGAPNGAILVSNDTAKTFTRVNMPIQMGSDQPGRYSGERLSVNPQHHNEIYFGSRDNGLWRSEDFGATWTQLKSFPVAGPTSGAGVIFEFFVPTSPTTETLYVGVSDPSVGLYSSTDGGKTWNPVAGQPTGYYPTNYDLSPDGSLYVTYANGIGFNGLGGPDISNGQVYKYNTSTRVWTAITPPNPWQGVNGGFQNGLWYGFSAVAVDRQNPNSLLVSTLGRQWWPGEEIFRSSDGGATWWPIGSEPSWSEPGPLYNFSSRTDSLAPYWSDPNCTATACDLTAGSFGWWISTLAIDPFDSNHALYGFANGIWETHDVTNVDTRQVIDWTVGSDGIEQSSVTALISPPKGVSLLSGIANQGGFRHTSLGSSPAAGSFQPAFTPSSMDFAQNWNWVIVRVGGSSGAYSTDNGITWTGFTPPTALNTIAVAADGKHWVATTSSGAVIYTADYGKTWNNSGGLPSGVNVASDRVNPLAFYAYSSAGGLLYRSVDGGVTFPITTNAPQWGSGIYVGYVAEGDLWIPNWTLNHSTDKGASFSAPSWSVGSVTALGFGMPAPGASAPALYMAGQVNGAEGIYRSTDSGANWTQINDVNHQWGAISAISGDPRTFGRIYVGTSGRGILYGDDPAACFSCQSNTKRDPIITWNAPAPISVGTKLSSAQLNATASYGGNALPGTFTYSPAAGSVMSTTGTKTLTVKFIPADYEDYNVATATVTLTVNGGTRSTAAITWPTPAAIAYGSALSSTQLDASANLPGTISYAPALGTVLGGGTQTLTATFTPTDPTSVAPASATTTIQVNKVTPVVTLTPTAGSITMKQDLGVTATVTGPGSVPTGSVIFSAGKYASPSVPVIAGTATMTIPQGSLPAGSDTLTATYKPDVSSVGNYTNATGSAQVTVIPLTAPTVTVIPEGTGVPYAENQIVQVTVAGANGTPGGTVILTSGSYSSPATALNSGTANFYLQPGTLPMGADTLAVNYTPDATSSGIYLTSQGTAGVTVTAPGSRNVAVSINTLANRHLISPYIYGVNTWDLSGISGLSPVLIRFGGNTASVYNWKLDATNSGGDWYFESHGSGVDSVQMTQKVVQSGSHMLTTMPMLDWVAKSSGWSYSVAKFGAQCHTDPYNSDAGNGFKPDCQTRVTDLPQTDAYYPLVDTASDCTTGNCLYRDEWAQALSTAFGTETCNVPYSMITTCHFYDMDNEPEIWNGPHMDVHPDAPGYNELLNRFVNEGRALKKWDPSAVRFGPVSSGSFFLFMAGGATDNKSAHAGIDFSPWWLNQLKWQDQIDGTRTLDVFDMHAYVSENVPTTGFSNSQLRAATGRVYRMYWDPTYYNSAYDADWITTTQPNRGVLFLIPRFKALVNAIYPGTPLSFSEYTGGLAPQVEWDFSTALADTDGFGVMGREGLSFSTRWGSPTATDGTTNQPHPNFTAFNLWTNYDGAKHGFGSVSVSDQSDANPDLFVSYAALDTTGTTMTIMVLNKDPNNVANVSFNLNGFNATTYTAYTVASTNPSAITHTASQSWSATQSFAPYSITLLVVSGSQNAAPASEWTLNPDDLMVPASGTGTLNPAITSGSAPVTLTSAVFDSFEGAPACNGSLTLTNATITASQPATITVGTLATPGFCHYTVTGTDGTTTQTQGGWIVVGQPAATFVIQAGNNQSGTAGTALSQPLTVQITPPAGTTFTAGGASVLFTTSGGTLSNGTTSGTSVIATTDSSGMASVTLTLPANSGPVTVTAQDQFALGGATVIFTENVN